MYLGRHVTKHVQITFTSLWVGVENGHFLAFFSFPNLVPKGFGDILDTLKFINKKK